LLVTAKI